MDPSLSVSDVPRGGSGAVELAADLEAGSASEFGLKVHVGAAPSGAAQETRIGYEPAKSRLFVDRARSGQIPAPIFAQRRFAPVALAQGRIHLHLFVDASSVEVFANEGEVVFTSQVFPDPHSNGIEFYAEGGHARLESLQLWALKSALPAMTAASAAAAPMASAPWWQHAVIYEIYPRSFQDSDGDGVGDLNGITSRLDYLRELGVDAVWLAPVYPSPQVDFGYDISAYTAIDPQYGTLADLDRLIAEAGKRHIRVLMDMVLNHTSDQHRWFQESMRSRTNDKADWFVWNDGIPADTPGTTPFQRRFAHDGRVPPNNWESLFGGSAWEWVPARAQFYYHRFYRQQPDLNWNNPAVETAMFDVMRFWLDRGVAGFRLDAITSIFEDPALRDEPQLGGVNDQGDPALDHIYTEGLATDALLRRMRTLVDSYPGNRVLIGETYVSTTAELDRLYGGASKDELQLPMDMLPGLKVNAKLTAPYQRRYLEEAQAQLHGSQPLLVYDNHDNARSIDRFGDGVHDVAIAKLLAALLYTTRATALTYYGAEIGMRTTPPTRREDVKDPIGITGWPAQKGRDGERTPMQWTPGAQAGFSTNPHTWLPIPPSHREVNVETERADPDSLLNWTRRLIALRRGNAAIRDGAMRMLDPDDAQVLIYARAASASDQAVIVALNMSDQPRLVNLEVQGGIVGARPIAAGHPPATGSARTLLSTDPSLHGEIALAGLELAPYAVWIAAVHR